MTRRQRRKVAPRKLPNTKLIAFQVALLVCALIAVIAMRDRVGTGTSALVESLTSEDVNVDQSRRERDEVPVSGEEEEQERGFTNSEKSR